MIGERAMASLTGDCDVLAGLLLVQDVRVAGFAGLMAGVNNGFRRNLGYGSSSEVSILAETPWNDCCAHNHKRREYDEHEHS